MSNVALLTGITGFIGRNLANKLLNHGWEIHAIIREESNLANKPISKTRMARCCAGFLCVKGRLGVLDNSSATIAIKIELALRL